MTDWRKKIPQHDWDIYKAAGYGSRGGLGTRPALLVIDVTYGFVGREPLPILESIARYPNSCGRVGWQAAERIKVVLDQAWIKRIPVFYTAGIDDNVVHHAGRWREKHPSTLNQPEDAYTIVEQLAPQPGNIIIRKTKPSAFYGSPLVSSLIDQDVDTVLVTGCTTSGCVRATVVDAFSNGFKTAVVEDGVFDRSELAHAVNLFDMDQKYADVIHSEEALEYLARLVS